MRAVMLHQKMYVKGIEGNVTGKEIDAPALPPFKAQGRRKVKVADEFFLAMLGYQKK